MRHCSRAEGRLQPWAAAAARAVFTIIGRLIGGRAGRAAGRAVRHTGDALVMVLPISEQAALAEAEHLRSRIGESSVRTAAGPVTLNLSIGLDRLVPRPDPDAAARRALERADDALYRAKRLGRNRVVRAEPAS